MALELHYGAVGHRALVSFGALPPLGYPPPRFSWPSAEAGLFYLASSEETVGH
jgi:hypothetical protein